MANNRENTSIRDQLKELEENGQLNNLHVPEEDEPIVVEDEGIELRRQRANLDQKTDYAKNVNKSRMDLDKRTNRAINDNISAEERLSQNITYENMETTFDAYSDLIDARLEQMSFLRDLVKNNIQTIKQSPNLTKTQKEQKISNYINEVELEGTLQELVNYNLGYGPYKKRLMDSAASLIKKEKDGLQNFQKKKLDEYGISDLNNIEVGLINRKEDYVTSMVNNNAEVKEARRIIEIRKFNLREINAQLKTEKDPERIAYLNERIEKVNQDITKNETVIENKTEFFKDRYSKLLEVDKAVTKKQDEIKKKEESFEKFKEKTMIDYSPEELKKTEIEDIANYESLPEDQKWVGDDVNEKAETKEEEFKRKVEEVRNTARKSFDEARENINKKYEEAINDNDLINDSEEKNNNLKNEEIISNEEELENAGPEPIHNRNVKKEGQNLPTVQEKNNFIKKLFARVRAKFNKIKNKFKIESYQEEFEQMNRMIEDPNYTLPEDYDKIKLAQELKRQVSTPQQLFEKTMRNRVKEENFRGFNLDNELINDFSKITTDIKNGKSNKNNTKNSYQTEII